MARDETRGRGTWVTVGVFVLLMLYVFSLGPAVALVHKGHVPWNSRTFRFLRWFYSPMEWLHDHTVLREPIGWYLEFWE
jgi:hypothetical protein